MQKELRNFVLLITSVTATIAILGGFIFLKFIPQYYLSVLSFMLILFFFVSIISFWVQLKSLRADMGKFSRSSMVVTFLKLMVYLIFGIIYMLNSNKSNLITFVVCLFILYLIYTSIEVAFLSKLARKR